jgi:hypothetical protein
LGFVAAFLAVRFCEVVLDFAGALVFFSLVDFAGVLVADCFGASGFGSAGASSGVVESTTSAKGSSNIGLDDLLLSSAIANDPFYQ